MERDSHNFRHNARRALANPALQQQMAATGLFRPQVYAAAVQQLPNFEALRQHVKEVKNHTLDHLDHYLAQYEEQVIANGGQVHWAHDGDELNRIVSDICRRAGARRIGKGKSMVTEETGLTAHLQAQGYEVTETDLGEYIIQIAGETPSHIVAPALHKPLAEIRELFLEQHALGQRDLETAEDMVAEARAVLRECFARADVGIIGANALVAENGYNMLVTNEGNGDLLSTLPKVHIVCSTIEKLVPRLEDATAQQRLLVRSATGQVTTAYTSFYSGPRRDDELDGPEEFHVVLLDNRRSDILASDYREILRCIRCGACLNHCPIYDAAGGHAYGWVYPGPMGSILTPLLTGLEGSNALPNACSSCGRCEEVCPSDIPLPELLRQLRHEEDRAQLSPARWRWGLTIHALVARSPRLYHAISGFAITVLHRLGRKTGGFRSLLLANGWTAARDFPAPEGKTFSRQWQQQQESADER